MSERPKSTEPLHRVRGRAVRETETKSQSERRKPENLKRRHSSQVTGRGWEAGGENNKVNSYIGTRKTEAAPVASSHFNSKPKSVHTYKELPH